MLARKVSLALLGLVLSLAFVPMAQALPVAWWEAGNDGGTIDSSYWSEDNGFWFLDFSHQTSQYQITATVAAQSDPYLSYGLSAVNSTGGDLDFAFGFITPIAPAVATGNTVYSSFSGSVTDVTGNGLHIAPVMPDFDGDGIAEMQANFLNGATDMGVDVGLGYTLAPNHPGNSGVFGPYSAGRFTGPLGNWTSLGSTVAFSLSGNNDIATLNGYVDILPVPEPASVMLLGFGLVGLSVAAARRRRS